MPYEGHACREFLQSASAESLLAAMEVGRAFAFVWTPANDQVRRFGPFAGVVGLGSDEGTGAEFLSHVHPDDVARLRAAIAGLGPRADHYHVDYRVIRLDGAVVHLSESARGEFDAAGRLVRLSGMTADITDRHRDAESLRRSEERFRLFAEATRDGFCESYIGGPTWWSDRLFEMVGVPPGSLEPSLQAWLSFLHPEDRDRVLAEYDRAVAAGERFFETEYRLTRADGSHAALQEKALLVCDPAGRLVRVVGAVRDITELKQAERSLAEACERAMQADKMKALGLMAAGVAHDFNNALAAVTALADVLLARRDLPADAAALVTSIRSAGLDAAAAVRRLQRFARQSLDPAPAGGCDLDEVAAEIPTLTRHRWLDYAQARGADIRMRACLGGGGRVAADASEVREILVNLVLNAADALPQGGNITLSTGRDDGFAWARVADDGLGMTEETRRRCLEPFFTTKGAEGSGMGLAVSWSVARRRGGEIACESDGPGRGSVFTVRLPACTDGDRPAAARLPSAAGLRVLVIDDQPLVAEAVASLLTSMGHLCAAATDGPAGLQLLAARPFDVVITDLGMPGMDGRAVARAAKSLRPAMPVLLLTGWGEQLPGGGPPPEVDRVIAKPATGEVLAAALASVAPVRDSAAAEPRPASGLTEPRG